MLFIVIFTSIIFDKARLSCCDLETFVKPAETSFNFFDKLMNGV